MTSGIKSKAEFFRLSRQGVFGNTLRQWTWQEYQALPQSRRPRFTSVRNVLSGGDLRVQAYALEPLRLRSHCERIVKKGLVSYEQLVLDETAPDDSVVLQCEVLPSSWRGSWEIRYALCSRLRMRPAYEIMGHLCGLRAYLLLYHFLDAPSWDQLLEIAEQHPDHVVELSCYPFSVGVFQWNTLFWEVRKY